MLKDEFCTRRGSPCVILRGALFGVSLGALHAHRFRDSGNIFPRDFAEHRRFITFAKNIDGREMSAHDLTFN